MKKIIVANWKMNYGFEEADAWVADLIALHESHIEVMRNVEGIVCPSSILIDNMSASLMDYSFEQIEENLAKQGKSTEEVTEEDLSHFILDEKPFSIGAQDCHFADSGAFTGDVSAKILAEVGAEFVILGHSERRTSHAETSEIIAQKIRTAAVNNLAPILCVGESKEQRDAGKHLEFVYRQLMASTPKDAKLERLIIAYEPIWAIGTGVVPTTKEIAEMAALIKKICVEKLVGVADQFAILYGGSASLENSAEIMSIRNVDGLLIGKASLDPRQFFDICLTSL